MDNVLETPTIEQPTAPVQQSNQLAAGNTDLERFTAGQFVRMHGLVSYEKKINRNKNGYFFIQFYDANNKCYNVYASKSAATTIEDGMDMDKGSDLSPEFFKEFKFMYSETPSSDRGYEWKLVSAKEGGNRESTSNLD